MIDYYSVSGCYILKPWSYGIWEIIQGRMSFGLTRQCSPLIAAPRLVQLKDPRDGRPERLLPHVCLLKGSREGEGSCRGFLSRGRLGHTSVRRNLHLPRGRSVHLIYGLHTVEHPSSKSPSRSVRRLRLSCILVSTFFPLLAQAAELRYQTTQNGFTATETFR